jgi:hypothetical protein
VPAGSGLHLADENVSNLRRVRAIVSPAAIPARRLTEAGLTIAGPDQISWGTDFESLCRAADPEQGG